MIAQKEFLDYISNLEIKTDGNYLNIPSAFDIETTSFRESSLLEKRGTMYIWMFGLYEKVTYGRTWDEFFDLLYKIFDILNLNNERQLIIYVHNLSFEFAFLMNQMEWDKIFALKARKIIYCKSGNVEFRCSYLLSGLSLEKVGENLKSGVRKKVGDLDYSLVRNSKTILTKKELKYCENDIAVLLEYIKEEIEKNGGISKIPLTKTGYVRRYCREHTLYKNEHKNYNLKYKKIIDELTLEKNEYETLQTAFMGGFTHANPFRVGRNYYNVSSFDFTSSYPAQMVYNYYPMSKGRKIEVKSKRHFDFLIKNYCCVFDVQFENLQDNFHYENYLSQHKCKIEGIKLIANGRVVEAEKLTTTITEIDYNIIKKCYTWDKIRVSDFYIYKRGYLPRELIQCALKFYEDKTKLKEVEGKEEEYLLAKEMLNSIYGMMVTNIIRDDIFLSDDGEWGKIQPDLEKKIEKENKNIKRFLYYPWGIYITAHARYSLWEAIFYLKEDYLYSDTDSVKILNLEKHKKWFIEKNNEIFKKLKISAKENGFELEKIMPENVKGVKKILGIWNFEGTYDIFKTLGAKRYLTKKHNEDIEITVSGLSKKIGAKWIKENYGNFGAFQFFSDGMYIPPEGSGKMTMTYISQKTEGYIKDYQGNIAYYCEESSCNLEPQPYELSVEHDFTCYLNGIFLYEN